MAAKDGAVAAPGDKEEVRELLARYCFALDGHRLAELAALFTPDGVWQSHRGAATGPADIEALLRRVAPDPATGAVQRHLNTSLVIDLRGDRATVRSYYAVIRPGQDGDPAVALLGDYDDVLVRTDAGWRFTRRVLTPVLPRH